MRLSLVAIVTLTAMGLAACQPNSQTASAETQESAPVVLESNEQKQDYALGASMGMYVKNRSEDMKKYGITFDEAALMQGFKDGIAGNMQFTVEELQAFARQADMQLKAKIQEESNAVAQTNLEEGRAYLEENGKRAGVITTESGLQYEVLVEGDGAQPTAADTVTVHYRGTLLDGTEFDSSYSRNEPTTFPLSRVIDGWTEGLQLMKEGSKFRFHIKSELAYKGGTTGAITPNSTLIFDVELIEVTKANASPE